MKDYPWGKGTPKWVRDATLNDSDKSFTVPDGKIWDVQYVRARLVCTATVGTRLMNVRIKPDGSTVQFITPNVSATASQSSVLMLGVGVTSTTNLLTNDVGDGVNASLIWSMPRMPLIKAGGVIQVIEYAAIDAAADDMIVDLYYVEYDA